MNMPPQQDFAMSKTSYSLQPEIDRFHKYEGRRTSKFEGIYMNSAVKQIITYELETRKVRSKREAGVKDSIDDAVKAKAKPLGATKTQAGGKPEALKENKAAAAEHWLSKLRTTVEAKQELKRSGGKEGGTICREFAYPMLYTYHEGVTNAVKRRIVLKELV